MGLNDGIITTCIDAVLKWGEKYSIYPMGLGISCCAIEMMSFASSRFDAARFGSEVFRMTPRQSDLLIVAGTVTYKMAWVARKIYDQMPEPKAVLVMGSCACSGGMFRSYSVCQGADKFLPVDLYIPGCPPRPEALIDGLLEIRKMIDDRRYKPNLYNFGKDVTPIPTQGRYE